MFTCCILFRLKPRGVPVGKLECWLLDGKWPLELASVREGAMCAGSTTYLFTRESYMSCVSMVLRTQDLHQTYVVLDAFIKLGMAFFDMFAPEDLSLE